jgi:hypothetical protein
LPRQKAEAKAYFRNSKIKDVNWIATRRFLVEDEE